MIEHCVLCGTPTPYTRDWGISERLYYIQGCGQLCQDCYSKQDVVTSDIEQKSYNLVVDFLRHQKEKQGYVLLHYGDIADDLMLFAQCYYVNRDKYEIKELKMYLYSEEGNRHIYTFNEDKAKQIILNQLNKQINGTEI